MTQIKKTLGIAGIIALATAPAMADIASTAYVQSIVNNIPKPAAATDSAAGLTKLYTGVGTNTDGAMTQAAVKTELDKKLENTATGTNNLALLGATFVEEDHDFMDVNNAIAIGNAASASTGSVVVGNQGAVANQFSVAIGSKAKAGTENMAEGAVAIGYDAKVTSPGGVAIGVSTNSVDGVAIGDFARVSSGVAIGYEAQATGNAIQLGSGYNDKGFNVAFGTDMYDNYKLLTGEGTIPAGRLVSGWEYDPVTDMVDYAGDNNGVSGQLLQTNGDGTMSWVDAPSAPTLASILPELPSECNSVKCALVHDNTDGAYKWEVVKVSE